MNAFEGDPFRALELAGLGDVEGARTLMAMGDPEFAALVSELAQMKAPFAPMAHPFTPTPGAAELPSVGLGLGMALFADGAPSVLARLILDLLTRHVEVFGSSGWGKSSLIVYLVGQLMAAGVPVWIFDSEMDEYFRRLAPEFSPEELLYFDTRTLRRNPFEPLGSEEPFGALSRSRDSWSESSQWGAGAANVFTEAATSLLDRMPPGSTQWPTLPEVLDRVENMRLRFGPRLQDYRASVVNRLRSVVRLLPCYAECREAGDFRIDRLLESRKSVIFSLRGIDPVYKNLIVKDVLTAAHAALEEQPSDSLRLAVVIDEAHQYLHPDPTRTFEPVLLNLAATFRKRGCGLILATQSPSELPTQVAAVASTRIAVRITDGRSARWVADGMALTREQAAYLLSLPERTAVVHYPHWPTPFLIEVPTLSFRDSAPPSAQWMRETLARMRFVPGSAPREDGSGPDPSSPRTGLERLPAGRAAPAHGLRKELLDYLELIAGSPLAGATERDRSAGVGMARGNAFRSALAELGMLRVHRVGTGRRGGTLALTELTGSALALLAELDVRPLHVRGRGGLVHQWHQHEVARLMRGRGWTAEVEAGEARADVALERDGRRVAVEICMTTERLEAGNIERDLAEGFDEVWVVCADAGVLERAERAAQGRARFMLLAQLASGNAQRTRARQEKRAAGDGTWTGMTETKTTSEDINVDIDIDKGIRGVEQEGKSLDPRRKERDVAGVGAAEADPAGRRERKRKTKRGTESNERRNRNGNDDFESLVAHALREIDDVDALEESLLARRQAVVALAADEFKGRAKPRGRALQRLIRLAAKRASEDVSCPNAERVRLFINRYAVGDSIAAIARDMALSREQVTRSYRPQAVELISGRLAVLLDSIDKRLETDQTARNE